MIGPDIRVGLGWLSGQRVLRFWAWLEFGVGLIVGCAVLITLGFRIGRPGEGKR